MGSHLRPEGVAESHEALRQLLGTTLKPEKDFGCFWTEPWRRSRSRS